MRSTADTAAVADAFADRQRRQAVAQFLENSTFHGLWRLQASSRQQQVAWLCIVSAALACLCLHVYQQVSEFHKYPLQSSTREILNDFHFPSVTICEAWQLPLLLSNASSGSSRRTLARNFLNFNHRLLGLPLSENVLQYHPQLAGGSRQNLDDLLIDCKFNGRRCNRSWFQDFHHSRFGSCFTFSARQHHGHHQHQQEGLQQHQEEITPAVSASNGLSLLLYSPSSDPHFRPDPLVPEVAAETGLETDGILVTAHAPGTAPRISEDSVIAATSHETKIGLKELRTSLVDTPSSPCHEAAEFSVVNPVAGEQSFVTTLADRLEWREMQAVMDECSCRVSGAAAGMPTQLQQQLQSRSLRHCADVCQAASGGYEQLEKLRLSLCRSGQRNNSQQCLQRLLEASPGLQRRLWQYQCSLAAAANASAAKQLVHDQCKAISYQFQIFTSELPDSQSADARSGRRDARLIFQTFANTLANFERQQRLRRRPPAVLRSLRATGLAPKLCAVMRNFSFDDESYCARVQDFISQHFVRVQVYPFSGSVVKITEERSYSFVDLLSHLGGILGLWVGSSIISLFELLDFVGVVAGGSASFMANQRRRRRRPARVLKFPAQSCSSVATLQQQLM